MTNLFLKKILEQINSPNQGAGWLRELRRQVYVLYIEGGKGRPKMLL